jgi:hypothetical protein
MKLKLPSGIEVAIPYIGLEWKNQGVVNTAQGSRHLYTSALPSGWWDYWKDHKDGLKQHGIACSKDKSGAWAVNCWMIPASGASKAHFREVLLHESRASEPIGGFRADLPIGVTPYPYQVAGVQ